MTEIIFALILVVLLILVFKVVSRLTRLVLGLVIILLVYAYFNDLSLVELWEQLVSVYRSTSPLNP